MLRLSLLLVVLAGVGACASWGHRESGGAIGAAAGATVGGIIGHNVGSTARGALIGAVVGGAAGAIIGHQMDQQAKELSDDIPGATVTRVAEGIAVTFASGLLYDFDSDVIRSEAANNLRSLAASLRKYPDTQLLVVGHTDDSGSDTYNQALSQRRADAARRFLGDYGIAADRIGASGRGESEPVTSNGTDAGRQSNRRIEVAIYANTAARRGY